MEFELTFKAFLIACPLVFLGGFVDSIAGGGGIITIPAYLMAGLPAQLANGTNKLSACFGTTISTIKYLRTGKADYGLAIPSIICALGGAAFGARIALILSANAFKILMLVAIPFIAIVVLSNKDLKPKDPTPLSRRTEYVIMIVASLIIGIYDGFYGPGTGTFLILIYTKLIKKDIITAECNAKLCNLASNVSSLIIYLTHGTSVLALGLTCAACSILGNLLGSSLAIKNGSKFVRIIILCVLALLAVKVLTDYFI